MPALPGDTVRSLIGDTPMVRLQRIVPGGSAQVWVKLEGLNPGGSVKDRAARHMVEQALASGALTPGKVILDSTSGNTGIALAMLGAALGYPVELVVPANVSVERKTTLAAYGATLHFSDPLTGSDGAILACRARHAADPDRFWKADQYNNPHNPEAHYRTTGPEIWRQSAGRVTHFVAAVGTSGTVMGTSRFLKEQSPAPQVIAVEPDDPFHGLEGMKHIASAIVPGIYDPASIDRTFRADTDAAYALTRRLALEEGILAGPSSGAAVLGALAVAAEAGPSGYVVTLACDAGTRYLSTRVFEK